MAVATAKKTRKTSKTYAKKSKTKENKKLFLKKLKDYLGVISYACEASGISRPTYYKWREKDEAFRDEADEISEVQVDFVEKKLLENVKDGNVAAQIFFLKTKGANRGYREKISIGGDADAPPIGIAVKGVREEFSDKALRKAVEALGIGSKK